MCASLSPDTSCKHSPPPSSSSSSIARPRTSTDRPQPTALIFLVPPRASSSAVPMPSLVIPGASSFTAMASATDEGLFASYLVSPEVSAALPEGYKLRPLRRSDYDTGFLDCLRVLTTVGDIAKDDFEAQYERMLKQEGYYIIVIEDDAGLVVATGALIVEHKFIHNLGAVGHIEDIAVSKSQQGKKLGLRLIQALDFVAERIGCYKSILDCSDANEGFYIKCGFRRAGLQMAHYYEGGKSKPQ
ncbi:acetyltransferase [Purpureocillium lavendulum]|uniref:Glucosamine 6-phosphate N-acetyltransferase n=1 Tax=Purpureocillium lavendulum TaxID=1247861 RepID=A0AB34FTR6_9HYPO|nr:acetyltransferase [Purpureocillium lavendulum]